MMAAAKMSAVLAEQSSSCSSRTLLIFVVISNLVCGTLAASSKGGAGRMCSMRGILLCGIALSCFVNRVAPQAFKFKPMTEIYPEDSEHVKALKTLFNAVDTDGFRKYYKENKISPNLVDSHGRGVYHWWARADLKAAGIFNPTQVVPILLILGEEPDRDLNIQDEDGNIPMHYFAIFGKDLPMKIHLNFGADPSIQNNEGKTPLHIAAEKGFERVVSVIVAGREESNLTKAKIPGAAASGPRRKLDPEVIYTTDNRGFTALHYAAAKDFDLIAADLVQAVPNPEDLINFAPPGQNTVPSSFQLAIRSNSRRVMKAFLELTKTPAELLQPDPQGYLPLHLAAAFGHEKIVKLLLDKFADSNPDYTYSKDAAGRNALHHAARFGRKDIMEDILDRTPEDRKLERLSTAGDNGWTPLHYAARYQHNFVVDLILKESKDDVNKKQSSGYTPLLLAALGCKAQPQATVVKQLLRAGADKTVRSSKGETAHDICARLGCRPCAKETALSPDFQGQSDGPSSSALSNCIPKPVVASSLFSQAATGGTTPISSKPCGTITPQRAGQPFCFIVEIFEVPQGAPSSVRPAQLTKIGLGVLIDETLVSTSASIFYVENELFPSEDKFFKADAEYVVRVPGGVSGRRRDIAVVGAPKLLPGFDPADPGSLSKDAALLELRDPVVERTDGTCFLCLPVQEQRTVPDRCFVDVLQCRVVSTEPVAADSGLDGGKWTSYPAVPVSVGNNTKCQQAAGRGPGAASTAARSDGGFCVSNIAADVRLLSVFPWCAGKSAPLICEQGGIVRLFGHQSRPSALAPSSASGCSINEFQGIFSSLLPSDIQTFYRSNGAFTGAFGGGGDGGVTDDRNPFFGGGGGGGGGSLFGRPRRPVQPPPGGSGGLSSITDNNGGDEPPSDGGNVLFNPRPLLPPPSAQRRPGSAEFGVRPGLTGGTGVQLEQGGRFQIASQHGPLS